MYTESIFLSYLVSIATSFLRIQSQMFLKDSGTFNSKKLFMGQTFKSAVILRGCINFVGAGGQKDKPACRIYDMLQKLNINSVMLLIRRR
jgi:hypothetical protein